MAKQDLIDKIAAARKAHGANMQKALLLAKGIPLEGEQVPVSHKECAFGKWIYGDAEKIKKVIGEKQYAEIEQMHETWHRDYAKIFDLFYSGKKTGIFGKLLGFKPKLSESEMQTAIAYGDELKEVTWTLTKTLEKIEKRVGSMPADCC